MMTLQRFFMSVTCILVFLLPPFSVMILVNGYKLFWLPWPKTDQAAVRPKICCTTYILPFKLEDFYMMYILYTHVLTFMSSTFHCCLRYPAIFILTITNSFHSISCMVDEDDTGGMKDRYFSIIAFIACTKHSIFLHALHPLLYCLDLCIDS